MSVERGRRLRLAMRPLLGVGNPYPSLLAEALEVENIDVSHMGRNPLLYPWRANVILMHWPNEFFFRVSFGRSVLTMALRALLSLGRLRNQKVVWLVHNLVPHERGGLELKQLRAWFFRRVDGLIFLSEVSRTIACQQFPELAPVPYLVVPHGIYPTRNAAQPRPRPHEDLKFRPIKLAFIGRVERYKRPDLLARLVAEMPGAMVSLRIAGACWEDEFARELRGIKASNVAIDLRYQSEGELIDLVDEADAIVLPYRDILNSGSVMMALGRERPTLAPNLGSLAEVRATVGDQWLHLYDGELTVHTIEWLLETLRNCSPPPPPDLSQYQWPVIGRRIASFLKQL